MNAPYPDSRRENAEDWLDQLLREDARSHVDDAGFTDTLMRKLPEPSPIRRHWRRWLPAGLTAVAAWLAIGVLPGSDVFLDGAADLLASDLGSPRVVALVGTMLVFFGVIAATVSGER